MQAQYGKEVLGVVRLNEARKHKAISKELTAQLPDQSAESKREIKKQIQAEKQQYSKIKKLRWALLTNGEKLTDNQYSDMQSILEKHSSLAVCYAMKEELVSLFRLSDPHEAEIPFGNAQKGTATHDRSFFAIIFHLLQPGDRWD